MQIFSRAFNVDLTTVTGVSTTLSIGYQKYILILLTKSTLHEILELFCKGKNVCLDIKLTVE